MEKSSGYDYEVFFSFRGPDTHRDITDYLYTSMIDTGIQAYKDNEELRIREEIGGQLLQAIEQSKILIPIFSKGYADSPWCLRELVKMVESKNTKKHKIVPIFYDVAPSEVKYQTEHYSNAIVSHANKKQFDAETINKWNAALNEVGALKGWDLYSKPNGQSEFVKEVVNNILTELKSAYLEVSDCLVEVDNHVDEIMSMIGSHNHKTKIVGIHGMGGVEKTTLAKIVCDGRNLHKPSSSTNPTIASVLELLKENNAVLKEIKEDLYTRNAQWKDFKSDIENQLKSFSKEVELSMAVFEKIFK